VDLHDQVAGEPDQGQQDVFEGGRQGQGLAAQGAQVSRLDGADVALRGDGVVGKRIALWRSHSQTISSSHILWSLLFIFKKQQ